MKTFVAKLDMSYSLTEEEVKEAIAHLPSFLKKKIENAENPTENDVSLVFEDYISEQAGSNSGSEDLANAKFTVEEVIE